MRVLVACEFSGVVREAFLRRGHDAYSCDLLPPLVYKPSDPRRHIIGDVRPLLREPWDLVIAHPPCTYLTQSGVMFLDRPHRRLLMAQGARLFLECLNANSPRVCVENPVPHGEAQALMGPYTQIIQPWMFGHPWTKRTALWLRGLLPLVSTDVCSERKTVRHAHESNQSDRWRSSKRSITYRGVAEAMVDQWGNLL